MPSTKSAERRMRGTVRKRAINRNRKSQLRTLETTFMASIKAGKKEEALSSLTLVSSALDKAAKTGVLHRSNADRKKSRYAMQVNRLK